MKSFALALALAALAGCAAATGPVYLGVRPGTARFGVTFVGSSGTLSVAGTGTIRQVGVRFGRDGWAEETDTTSDLPRALAHETAPAGLATRATSELSWERTADRDEAVDFALKRVLRLIDFRPDPADPATTATRITHEPTAKDPALEAHVRFASRAGRTVTVDLRLEPDLGLVRATAETASGTYRLHRLDDAPG